MFIISAKFEGFLYTSKNKNDKIKSNKGFDFFVSILLYFFP